MVGLTNLIFNKKSTIFISTFLVKLILKENVTL